MKKQHAMQLALVFFLLIFVAQGCSLFKKKCDCPSFGGKGKSHHSGGPGW
ncbi:MAG: hypothetical protein ABI772_04185 [Bacteroidota bacterium]